MNDFLERIRAHPDDDRLRAVYGDWLIEQGDERGEFIALQLKRARHDGTPEDLRRERELLSTNWYAWSGPLAKALHRDESTFERGFLTHVTMPRVSTPKKLLNALVGDPHWATVRSVRNVHINKFYQAILMHPVMHRLSKASMDDDELVELENAPWKLRELELRAWKVEPAHARMLSEAAPFSMLRALELRTTSMEHLRRLDQTLAKLERLKVFFLEPGDAPTLLQFLTSNTKRETTIEWRTHSATVSGGRLDLRLSAAAPDALELARISKLQPGSISWNTEEEPAPESWPKLAVSFEQLGFRHEV